jgi:Ca2+-binding EF-hand superfamily protein
MKQSLNLTCKNFAVEVWTTNLSWHNICNIVDVHCELQYSYGETTMKSYLMFLTAMGLSVGALAQELPAFEEVDIDHDGMISELEAAKVEALDFTTADTNQDGWISRDEYSQLN